MIPDAAILLVEDEVLLREMARDDLEDLGFTVICAGNSEEALRVLETATPLAALFTDIRMPGAHDGWELARRARKLRPDLPVLYVSGYCADDLQPVSGGLFISKPYRLRDIQEALDQLIPA